MQWLCFWFSIAFLPVFFHLHLPFEFSRVFCILRIPATRFSFVFCIFKQRFSLELAVHLGYKEESFLTLVLLALQPSELVQVATSENSAPLTTPTWSFLICDNANCQRASHQDLSTRRNEPLRWACDSYWQIFPFQVLAPFRRMNHLITWNHDLFFNSFSLMILM